MARREYRSNTTSKVRSHVHDLRCTHQGLHYPRWLAAPVKHYFFTRIEFLAIATLLDTQDAQTYDLRYARALTARDGDHLPRIVCSVISYILALLLRLRAFV